MLPEPGMYIQVLIPVPKQSLIQQSLSLETGFVHVPTAASQEQGGVGSCALMHLHVPMATVRKINGLFKSHYTCKMTPLLAKEAAVTLGTGEVRG